jgi:hypothetical protein
VRRWEWREQVRLSQLLSKWLDRSCSFATAIDNVASSALSGFVRRKRGVVPGLPDNWIIHRTKRTRIIVAIELKSPSGKCSRPQREVREALLRAGVQWWVCRTANSAMHALRKSRVTFREIVNDDGTVECWQQPKLARWELPRRDPSEPRAQHPEVAARRRATQGRWRARRRAAREAAVAAEQCQARNVDVANSALPGAQGVTVRRRSVPGVTVTRDPS